MKCSLTPPEKQEDLSHTDNYCFGCNAFQRYRRNEKRACLVFEDFIGPKLERKFVKYYCPCKNCLVKSICTNDKRMHIEEVLKVIHLKEKIPFRCELIYKNVKRFALKYDLRAFP